MRRVEDSENSLALLTPCERDIAGRGKVVDVGRSVSVGHASPEITRGIYLHSLPAGAKEAVQKVEDLLTGPKRTQIEEIRNLGTTLIQ